MSTIALVVSLMLVVTALLAIVYPQRLAEFARSLLTQGGMYATVVVRLVFGIVFLLAASDSRLPWMIRSVGSISILGGVIAPMFGLDRHRQLLDWWAIRGSGFKRGWAALAFIVGVVLAYAFIQ